MSAIATYKHHQDSGVEWVGPIPTTWKVLPFYRFARQCRRSNKGMTNNNLLSLSYGRIIRKSIEDLDGLLPESFETYQVVESNDVVFRLTDLQNDKRSLRSAICNELGIITSAYLAVSPRNIEPAYFAYLMRAYDLTKVFYSLGGGLRQSLKFDEMKRLPVLAPSLNEQTQIARFLDYETAKIDRLIDKQQQLIALLKEKRQAVISHAVTKGLNPNAPMKDSGVEWLGQVPAHWHVCRLKQASDFITSGPRGWSDLIDDSGTEIFLQSGDLNDNLGLRLDTAKRIPPPQNAEGSRTRMQAGDVVVCITGANTGRVAMADSLPITTYVNQHLCLVRLSPSLVLPRFLANVLSSTALKTHFEVTQYGLKEGLSLGNVGESPIVLPPIDEQELIVTHLRSKEAHMDALEDAAIRQIGLLQERRTALISAAVTGKIDVRDWTPPGSDEEAQEAA